MEGEKLSEIDVKIKKEITRDEFLSIIKMYINKDALNIKNVMEKITKLGVFEQKNKDELEEIIKHDTTIEKQLVSTLAFDLADYLGQLDGYEQFSKHGEDFDYIIDVEGNPMALYKEGKDPKSKIKSAMFI